MGKNDIIGLIDEIWNMDVDWSMVSMLSLLE